MIAMGCPSEIELMEARIEVLERAGQHGIADRLRDELAEMRGESSNCAGGLRRELAREDDDEFDDLPSTEEDIKLAGALELFSRIKRLVARLGIHEPADLAHWNFDRFRRAGVLQRDIEYIYGTMAAVSMSHIIGSAEVPDTVPEPSPYAIDLMDGRTPEDCETYLWELARGKPQRDVSFDMGSPRGWHQRAGSLISRLNRRYAEICAIVIRDEEFKGAAWLRGIEIERLEVRERPWTLRIRIACDEDEAARHLGIVTKAVHGGFSRRGVRVIFDTGENQVQEVHAKATKLGGKKPWRVTDQRGIPLTLKSGRPVDRGGYASQASAQEQAAAVNATLAQRRAQPLTKKQKRARRSAEIALSRKGRDGAVHLPKPVKPTFEAAE